MKKCGIYIIKNITNGKVYIGQSKRIKERFYLHKYWLKRNIHFNPHLQIAWNRDGSDSFEFEILEECSPDRLDEREIYYIELYSSYSKGYNRTVGGKPKWLDFKKLNLEDKEKLSKIRSETAKKNMEARRVIKRKCKICGAETKDGWSRYCENHKYPCSNCENRISARGICAKCLQKRIDNISNKGYKKSMYVFRCWNCETEIIKTNNHQKYCKNCAKIIRRKQDRQRMWDKRHNCND